MTSGYPGAQDTFAVNKQDDLDAKSGSDLGLTTTIGDHAQHHNDLADAVNKIEAELGTLAKGIYAASVRERFEIAAFKSQSVSMATTANLAANYANGTAGVGATLTATANGVMAAIDGVTPVATTPPQRVLVKNQTAPAQNGIYTVTSVGAAGAPWVLTRAIDADTSAKIADVRVLVDQGSVAPFAQQDTEWGCVTTAPDGHVCAVLAADHPVLRARQPAQLWAPGATNTSGPPVMETMPYNAALGQWTVAVAAPQQWLIGGLVAPAGRTVTNINYFALVAGAAPTVSWFALARQSDRLVECHTANIVTAPSITAITTRAARYALDADRGHAGLARHELHQRDDSDDPPRRRRLGSEPRRAEPHRPRALRYQRRHTDHDGPDRRHYGHHRPHRRGCD
jgi:hypothetical protein